MFSINDEILFLIYCFLAALTAGFASLLTNGRTKIGEGEFSKSFIISRILIALSTGFPAYFIAHKYIIERDAVIVVVWVVSFVADQALPHLKEILLKLVLSRADSFTKDVEEKDK
jgi:hypothetical protein